MLHNQPLWFRWITSLPHLQSPFLHHPVRPSGRTAVRRPEVVHTTRRQLLGCTSRILHMYCIMHGYNFITIYIIYYTAYKEDEILPRVSCGAHTQCPAKHILGLIHNIITYDTSKITNRPPSMDRYLLPS